MIRKSWLVTSGCLAVVVAGSAIALQWRADARAAKREIVGRDYRCKIEIAAAIRQLRAITEERLKRWDACERAEGAQSFEMVYWPMTACFSSRGDWSNYRQHFDAALILKEPDRANRVLDGLDTALQGARFGDVRYPSLGPPPKVPLCMKM